MTPRLGDPIGHAWLTSFGSAPELRRRRERLLARAGGEVVDLGGPHALAELAEGLKKLHAAGAIIEGLRPDIVVVSAAGQAGLTDLSDLLPIPVAEDAQVQATTYTAPELVLDREQADARADLYSFGAMLYALFLGRELTLHLLREHAPHAGDADVVLVEHLALVGVAGNVRQHLPILLEHVPMALLEGGTRTATLGAETRCRVAVIPGDLIDRQELEDLAATRQA